uniref:Uncharacterized protein n=1 Tax=Arundo donax TaxID=35708 RepID=A0A0A9FGB9_ARUDO
MHEQSTKVNREWHYKHGCTRLLVCQYITTSPCFATKHDHVA